MERGLTDTFNIGMMELLLVLLVAFLVVGPKDLPKVARWIARQVKSLKRLIRDIKKETGWDEFAREFRDTKEDIQNTARELDLRSEFKAAADEVKQSVDEVRLEVEGAAETVRQSAKDVKDQLDA